MCLAIPGQILEIFGDQPLTRMARISFGGIVKEASLAYVPDAKPGDFVLVHAGFALNTLDAAEARRTLEMFAELGEEDSGEGL